jgi:hypothetical protein
MFLDIIHALFLSKAPSCLYLKTQEGVLDKNVQKHNSYTNTPLSQSSRSYLYDLGFVTCILQMLNKATMSGPADIISN